jgi:pimeloyl-ACP methyl ester carboxylesterase
MLTSYGLGQYSGSAGATEAHQLALPRRYKADGSKRLVVWCHSAGGLATEPFIAANLALPTIAAVVETLGLPLISFDGAIPSGGLAQHWGNDTSQARLTDAIAFMQTQVNAKVDKIILLGVSMGGMLALNWARANPTKVAALGLMYPATSLQAIHDATGGAAAGATSSIEAAYGGSLGTFNTAVAAHDPSQNTGAIAGLSAPAKMWYSTADTTVGTANQTAFATAVGAKLQLGSLGAAAHADMTQVPVVDLQRFAGSVP